MKPGGVFFGTYVNRLALDGYRQFVSFERLRDAIKKGAPLPCRIRMRWSLQRKLAAAGFEHIEIKGAMFAPLRPLYKLSPRLATSLQMDSAARELAIRQYHLSVIRRTSDRDCTA